MISLRPPIEQFVSVKKSAALERKLSMCRKHSGCGQSIEYFHITYLYDKLKATAITGWLW